MFLKTPISTSHPSLPSFILHLDKSLDTTPTMARIRSLISPLPAFVFAALSFSFAIVAITSRDWSRRNYYDPGLNNPGFRDPIYSEYRSPFQICTVYGDANNGSIFHEDCKTFRAYGSFGSNATSCEILNITGSADASNTGDQRLCQQIHYAGNLDITSVAFVSLGFVMTLFMTIFAYLQGPAAGSGDRDGVLETQAADNGQRKEDEVAARHGHGHGHHHNRGPSFTPYLNLVLITSFAIGATAALISQFYGIIGLIQSQPTNGAFAVSPGAVVEPSSTLNTNHGPWIQGRALKYWVTLSWIFAAFAAGAAGAVWRLPRWEKDI
jgi:hypothetical protein